jgi:hypothetical protein
MSALLFWQPNHVYPPLSYIFDGTGNIQFSSAGGTSGTVLPTWSMGTTHDGSVTWVFIGFGGKIFELQKQYNQIGPYFESLTDAISYSRGSIDAGKYVLLNTVGQLDASMGGGGGGSPPGSSDFAYITTGLNDSATMTVGTGAMITVSGDGVVESTELATSGSPVNVSLSTPPSHAGQLLISQPGNVTAVWADPLVQGLYPPSTRTDTGNAGGPINPVLIGGSDYAGSPELWNIKVDSSGNIYIGGTVTVSLVSTTITGTVAVTGAFYQATQPVSGSVSISNFPSTQAVTGTFWQATQPVTGAFYPATQPVSNAALSEMSFTNYGSPAVEALNTYVVNPISVAFPSSLAVTGTFWQATQPVSGSVSVSNFPATQAVTGTVSVSNLSFTNYGSPAAEGLNVYVLNPLSVTFPASLPVTQSTSPWVVSLASTAITGNVAVTGAFWQATQPVSGSVSVSNFTFTNYGSPAVEAANVYVVNPVTFPASVTVAGTVAVSNFPATQAVTGTFWQATQPVSNANLSFTNYGSPLVEGLNVYVLNPSSSAISGVIEVSATTAPNSSGNPLYVDVTNTVPVTGTFWQASQPVSNAALSEMMFTPYGSPPCTALSVYVVNPVSITGTVATSVSNFPSSQPVTGTFWQATQPVRDVNLSYTPYGSPAVEAANVYVVNPSSSTISGIIQVSATTAANASGNPLYMELTDSVHVATIKAASTAALSTDTALVVTESGSTTSSLPAQTAVSGGSPASLVGPILILAANTARRECIIVNTGTTVIYLALGQTPTTAAYAIPLSSCSTANDGTGGSFVSDVWKGSISAISSASGGTVVVTELT